MPFAYWCPLIAGLLPHAWALVAKLGVPYDNHRPREVLAHAQGHRNAPTGRRPMLLNRCRCLSRRCWWPACNTPTLARSTMPRCCLCWRLAHGLFYIADLARPRSLVWLLGIGCVMYLFLLAGRLL